MIGVAAILCAGCDTNFSKKKVVLRYPNGNLEETFWLENGKKEGVVTHYYEEGGIKWISNFSKGIRVGVEKKFFKNGKASHVSYFRNGVMDSVFYNYYETGELRQWGHVLKGQLFKDAYWYYPNGLIKQFCVYGFPDTITYYRKYDETGKAIEDRGRICFFYGDFSVREFQIGDTIKTIILCGEPPDLKAELYYLQGCDWPRVWKPIRFEPNEPKHHRTVVFRDPDSVGKHYDGDYRKYKVVTKNRYTDSVEKVIVDSFPFTIKY